LFEFLTSYWSEFNREEIILKNIEHQETYFYLYKYFRIIWNTYLD